MGKYIIEVGDAYAEHICGKGDMLCLPVRINEFEDNWLNTNIPLTPYTEPNTDEAYRRGYETAKHECEDCRKIRADAEQELADKAYQSGLSDAWEAAKKIAISEESGGLTCREMQRIFCTDETDEIFDMSASEAIEKIRQYEQEQEEQIQVGDEVKWKGDEYDAMFVVTHISEDGYISGIASEELSYNRRNPEKWTKTGRRFPEHAEILAKMREGS